MTEFQDVVPCLLQPVLSPYIREGPIVVLLQCCVSDEVRANSIPGDYPFLLLSFPPPLVSLFSPVGPPITAFNALLELPPGSSPNVKEALSDLLLLFWTLPSQSFEEGQCP